RECRHARSVHADLTVSAGHFIARLGRRRKLESGASHCRSDETTAERKVKASEGRWDKLGQRRRYMVVEIAAQSVAALEHASVICGVKHEKKSRRFDRACGNHK